MPQGVQLYIPFPSRVSPDFNRAQANHMDWPRRFGLLPTQTAEIRHLKGNYPDVASRFHPTALGADLDLGVDQQSWYFIFDDFFDGRPGDDVAEVRRLTGIVAACLTGPAPAGEPLAAAFADLWIRSRIGMSASWVRRAAANWRAYLAGVSVRNSRPVIGWAVLSGLWGAGFGVA
jgi:pentalenene synthase